MMYQILKKGWAQINSLSQVPGSGTQSANATIPVLYIGCTCCAVPAHQQQLLLQNVDIIVHHNLGNQVIFTDFNLLSAIEYAVEQRKVQHIIISGHYGCKTIEAALHTNDMYMYDHWLRQIKDLNNQHIDELLKVSELKKRSHRLAELNVSAQVNNLSKLPVIQKAWFEGSNIRLHGWMYNADEKQVTDLNIDIASRHTVH